MQTKIRTIEGIPLGGYKHLYLQVLDYRNKNCGNSLEVIGEITFQQTLGNDEWYALNFKINTDNPDHILKMAKIARYIKENCYYNAQPDEIKKVLGAIEYFSHHLDFYPTSILGQNFYKVMDGDRYYSSIVAPNEIIANKTLEKKYKGKSMVFSHVINLYN